jgi:DNA helicase IV
MSVTPTTGVFNLPATGTAASTNPKAAAALISADERHFAAITESLESSIAELSERLDAERKAPGGSGQEALERDIEIRRLTSRLRSLRRFGLDLCLGRIVSEDADGTTDADGADPDSASTDPVYIGRFGLTDSNGRRLLLDWRSPAAEPFFGATHGNPMGLVSRRRYRWTNGRISDYWDEVFTPDGFDGNAALDDQSAFIASLGSSRSPRMRDVLGTIQADQDAIIRAGSHGALVVDGGPGTGKTVVALHRSAYLLYSDPRLSESRGGVLFVGPHAAYLAYVADVLPALGEDGVQTCTVRDLVVEGATATVEANLEVARLKSSTLMVKTIEAAVAHYEKPPTRGMTVETHWADVELGAAEWDEAFGAADAGLSHNESRDLVWEQLLDILMDQHDEDVPLQQLRRALQQNTELRAAFNRAWPLLDAAGLVGDLFSVPAYLQKCAPWLTPSEVQLLQRDNAQAWTVSDLPLVDAARQRIGDPTASRRKHQHAAAIAAERERIARVVDDLLEADDDGDGVVTMLTARDMQDTLLDASTLPSVDPDLLAGPFSHIVVDEAQELTDAEWQMLLVRCPSRSFTIVGDRAQARHGFTETWEQRLERVGLDRVTLASLSINYRTPSEVMAEAEPVIRAVLPDANVPTSVRSSGISVAHGSVTELPAILDTWLAANAEGIACVIGDESFVATFADSYSAASAPSVASSAAPSAESSVAASAVRSRVRSMTAEVSKGLEFDLVVLVDPDNFGTGIEGAVDRYVAMTRATQQMTILTSE